MTEEQKAKQRLKVGVLMGGLSAEREISLLSGERAHCALLRLGYNAQRIDAGRHLDQSLRKANVDLVFNALHGRFGEDGCVQGLMELMGVPYTGSGVTASALSMDKVKAKELFRVHNLPTPPYYTLGHEPSATVAQVHGAFGFPVVVKPVRQGSSFGVSVAHTRDELQQACDRAFQFDDIVLVERLIVGREVHVGIVANAPLGAIEIVARGPIFDYPAKYTQGQTEYHLPPRLPVDRLEQLKDQALRAHQALGCKGVSRVNMMVSELDNEYILEVNTVPGLTENSLLPKIARGAGMTFDDLIDTIVTDAVRRHEP